MTLEGPVLVIAAHPDDEILGCGGTMARLAAEGTDVHIAILGEGITSRSSQREQADPADVARLQEMSVRAAAIIGAREPRLFGLPDNRFDTVPLLDIVKILERLIGELRPATVFTQHGGDLNVDHAITCRATLTATRPLRGQVVRNLLACEAPSATDWAFQQFEPRFRPNLFMEIAGQLETKIRAMAAYESETREFPHPRSPEALHANAERWGSAAGMFAAEAFEIVRIVQ